MKIAYVGGFHHSFSTEGHVARDAESLGIQVDRIAIPPNLSPGWQQLLEDRASEADLLVYSPCGLPIEATEVWRNLEARGVATCSYHLDLFVGLRRQAQIGHDPLWTTGTVFTADGHPATTERLASRGINHKWLPAAVVSDEIGPGEWRKAYDYDVVFVGGGPAYHSEWPWRGTLIRFLQQRYGQRFKLFGHHPPTRGQDLNDLYATARVVVGDSLCLPHHTRFWSDRYYESVGRGGFLIAPYVPGIEAHFTDFEHLRYYTLGNTQGLSVLIDHYLDHPQEARQIAQQGNAHVQQWHTYRNRVQQMLAHLDLAVPTGAAA